MDHLEHAEHMVAVMRGWDHFECELNPDALILDVDVAPPGPILPFSDRGQIDDELRNLADELQPDNPDRRALDGRLSASRTRLALKRGDAVPMSIYVPETMHVAAGEIPEGMLEELRAGYRALETSYGTLPELGTDEVPNEVKQAFVNWAPDAIRNYVAIPDIGHVDIDVKPRAVSWTAYYSESAERGQFLDVNSNSPLARTRPTIRLIMTHEHTHAGQRTSIRDGIEAGDLNPALGQVTPHTPEVLGFETAAIVLEYLATRGDSETPVSTRQYVQLREMYRTYAVHNMHHLLMVTGDIEAAARFGNKWLSDFYAEEQLVESNQYRFDHDWMWSYVYTYAKATEYAVRLMEMPRNRQRAALQAIVDQPMILEQIEGKLAA